MPSIKRYNSSTAQYETIAGGPSQATLDTRYPQKASTETISGSWDHTGALTKNGQAVVLDNDSRLAGGLTIRAVSVNTTAVYGEVLGVDASSGNRVITLPAAAANGKVIHVKKTDGSGNTVTLSGTIDGTTNYVIVAQNENVSVVGNASASGFWII